MKMEWKENGWEIDPQFRLQVGHLGFFRALFKDDGIGAYPSLQGPEVVCEGSGDVSFDSIICHCGILDDGSTIYGLDDGSVCFVSKGAICRKMKVLDESVFCLAVLGQFVIVGGASRQVSIFDRKEDTLVYAELIDQGIADIAAGPGGIFVSCWDGKIRVFDFDGVPKRVMDMHEGVVNKLLLISTELNIRMPRSGALKSCLVSGGKDGRIFLWAIE